MALQLAPDSPPALVKLVPEGVISGQVSDETGEPLEGFTVAIYFRNPNDGHLYPDQRHRARTDDEGKFRVAGLPPGSCFLRVAHLQGPVLDSSRKSPAPIGYPLAFYPGVSDAVSAVPFRIRPGRTAQANFSLKREPFVQLSGTVSGYTPQEQIVLMLWDSSGTPQNSEISFDPASGAFHTKWIPPGVYTFTAQSAGAVLVDGANAVSIAIQSSTAGPNGLRRLSTTTFASLRVNAITSLSDVHLALQPTVDIHSPRRQPARNAPVARRQQEKRVYFCP